MYSLVLMTAMTSTPDVTEFNGFFRDLFCCPNSSSNAYAPQYSCYGGGGSAYNSNCSGSGYPTNCSGSSAFSQNPNGCCGGSPGFGTRVRRWFESLGSCCGCCGGSGSGYSYGYGCSGSVGYSCTGSQASPCFSCPPVSYTPMFNGGLSCQGGYAWPAPPPTFEPYPTTPYPNSPGGPPPSIPYAPPEVAPPGSNLNTGLRPASYNTSALMSNGNPSARATVIVKLPIDARLYAETKALVLTGAERTFVSPELPAGQEFVYRFRAEYERDGETVTVTKKVPVRAGGTATIEFTDLTAKAMPEKYLPEKNGDKNAGGPSNSPNAVAAIPTGNPGSSVVPSVMPANPSAAVVAPVTPSASSGSPATDRATLTVKLPPGATLYVDDRKSPSNELVRQFSTPPIPVGREFAYLMRTEIVRNGQTETFTQKVPFRAGERVEVDFTTVGR
jgi:uncharacterized protein (TIGR03000 family)